MSAPRIDRDDLWLLLELMAAVGGTAEGGCTRLAYSEEEDQAHVLLASWAAESGCTSGRDEAGNLYLFRAADEGNTEAPLLIGSHLDTVPSGGRYDGAYGVIAGLAVLRALNSSQTRTARPVVVAAFRNEEGARFAPATMGSGYFAGTIDLATVLSATDRRGVKIEELLEQGESSVRPGKPYCYLEAHIEQGPVLVTEGVPIGVVSGVFAQISAEVAVTGREGHAGTTPMGVRRDALVGASRIIASVRDIAGKKSAGEEEAVATVGEVSVSPGSRNAIPGRVIFTLDIRAPRLQAVDTLYRTITARATEIALEENLKAESRVLWSDAETGFAPVCVDAVSAAARELSVPSRPISSGAGHDAVNLAQICPAGMLFIPCRNGISHSPDEAITPFDAFTGASVLLSAALILAR